MFWNLARVVSAYMKAPDDTTDTGKVQESMDNQAFHAVINGPKIPKSQVAIPEWIEPEKVSERGNGLNVYETQIAPLLLGTTPTGREMLQKILHRLNNAGPLLGAGEVVEASALTLNAAEKNLLELMLADSGTEAKFIAENLWRADYRHRPPSMAEFLTDPEYLGTVANPNLPGGVWPAWFKILVDDFDRDSRLHNVVLTGALGTGKTTVLVIILLYRICLVLLLKRPAEMFGQGVGTPLYFVMLSVTREAAKQTAFAQAFSFMAASPFFRKMVASRSSSEVKLTTTDGNETKTQIILTSGSRSQHLIGRNIIGIAFDEGNFRLEQNPGSSGFELYGNMRSRLITRLKTQEGNMPGITIVASSAQDESSLTERIRREIDAARNPREQQVFQKAIFEVKPLHAASLRKFFKVAYGVPNQEPKLIDGEFGPTGEPLPGTSATPDVPSDKAEKTALIPMIYREEFVRNCRQALQNICGISSGGSGRLFATMADVNQCLEISKSEGVSRAWRQDEISISAEDKNQIWDYLDHPAFMTRSAGQIVPLRHPDRLRYCHLDLATQSCAGMAICHLGGERTVDGLVKDGEPFSESRLIVEYDLILAIKPGKSKPINFEKIQKFFLWLKKQCGFKFGIITADMFQSEMPLQMLEAQGFNVGRLSIDRDKTAYRQWRAAFEEKRIRLMPNQRMYEEAAQLIEGQKKFDHQPKGSKDVTDAAAGAYLNAVNSEEAKKLTFTNEPVAHLVGSGPVTQPLHGPPIAIPLEPYSSAKTTRMFDA